MIAHRRRATRRDRTAAPAHTMIAHHSSTTTAAAGAMIAHDTATATTTTASSASGVGCPDEEAEDRCDSKRASHGSIVRRAHVAPLDKRDHERSSMYSS